MLISASLELPPPSFPISLHKKTISSREREERLRQSYERWIAEEGVEFNEDDSIYVRASSGIYPLRFSRKTIIPGRYMTTKRKEDAYTEQVVLVVGRLENHP
jgi:hypothetical protein